MSVLIVTGALVSGVEASALYESVRGCPYRLNFCNYPYLFSDNRFRYKSARRMVEDWEHYISTLDLDDITCHDNKSALQICY
jgi:radical SAM superfamily enzyme YgiQ (UPF0313 family)